MNETEFQTHAARLFHDEKTTREKSFDRLYNEFAAKLTFLLSRAYSDQGEEGAQEAFCFLWQLAEDGKRRDFPSPKAFLSWLYTVGWRRLCDVNKRNRLSGYPTGADFPDPKSSLFEDDFEQLEELVLINEAIEGLSEEEHAVIQMRYSDHLSDPDIAHALKIRQVTVRSRVARAFKRIRQMLSVAGGAAHAVPPPPGHTAVTAQDEVKK